MLAKSAELRQAKNPRKATAHLLRRLYKDPYLAALGAEMKLSKWVLGVASSGSFDVASFRAAGALAARRCAERAPKRHTFYALRVQNVEQLIDAFQLKLGVIEAGLSAAVQAAPKAPPSRASVPFQNSIAQLQAGATELLWLERVPGVRLVDVDGRFPHEPLALDEAGRAELLQTYGRQLVPEGRSGRGDLRPGLAQRDVGRAVLDREMEHPQIPGLVTNIVQKGPGPTRWAGNHFSIFKRSGYFPVDESQRDVRLSRQLSQAGVPVYQPHAIIALPYLRWKAARGWEPMAIYTRLPQESLRISDLANLSASARRALTTRLRQKIAALLKKAGRKKTPTDLDVLRFLTERLGRIAGLFHGGGFGGRIYFHGMLHEQNVSLMAEMVDLGNNDGFAADWKEHERFWKKSVYGPWGPWRKLRRGALEERSEKGVLLYLARYVNMHLREATKGGLQKAELDALFERAYLEGKKGVSADDASVALRGEAQ